MRESAILFWWDAYGSFTPGEGNLPHIGEVIEHYRLLSGLSRQEAAEQLGWTKRYIELLESKRNKIMPDLITRRILLCKTLGITPVLLGLSPLLFESDPAILNGQSLLQTSSNGEKRIDLKGPAFYEGMLALGWQFYLSSNVVRTAKQVNACFDLLQEDRAASSGVEADHYTALTCRYYQLLSLVHRDQAAYDLAEQDANKAVEIAYRLKNAELIASSLLRRTRVLIGKGLYAQAYQDGVAMLPYADLCKDPLQGKCYQNAGESTAYIAGSNRALQDQALSYFTTGLRLARKGDLTPDGSFVQLDVTSVCIEKAKALRLFGRFDEAHETLALAHKALPVGMPRWKVNLLIEEGRTYLAERDVESAANLFLDALRDVRAHKLVTKEATIKHLSEECAMLAPRERAVQDLVRALQSA